MDKSIAAIEISSNSVKLVIGNVANNRLYVLYTMNKPIKDCIDENGNITDREYLISVLKSLNVITDDLVRLRIQVSDCLLALPPYDLEVKLFSHYIGVSSDELKISNIDLKSCYNQVKNTTFVDNHVIVDIVPREYKLDADKTFNYFPIGQISHGINISGVAHFLPNKLVASYQSILENSNIAVKKMYVAPFVACEMIAASGINYNEYFLLDIGSKNSVLSLVGNQTVVRSRHILWGGSNITEKIMTKFNINYADAEKYKILYGLDRRELSFKPTVCQVESGDGNMHEYHTDDLNAIIKEELDVLVKEIGLALDELVHNGQAKDRRLPMLLVGGGSQLTGLIPYIEPKLPNEKVEIVPSTVVGARNPSFINCLGMIYSFVKYPSFTDDRIVGTGNLTRKDNK